MKELEKLRYEIDNIDKQIVRLFERRMEIVSQVAKIKIENNINVLDSKREEMILEKNIDYLNDKELIPYLREFYRKTMDLSKEYQNYKINNYKL